MRLSDCWPSYAVAAYLYLPVLFSFFYFLLPTTKIIFSEKNILKNFFFCYQKRKLFSLKQKHFCFIYLKKKDKAISFYFEKGNNYF